MVWSGLCLVWSGLDRKSTEHLVGPLMVHMACVPIYIHCGRTHRKCIILIGQYSAWAEFPISDAESADWNVVFDPNVELLPLED